MFELAPQMQNGPEVQLARTFPEDDSGVRHCEASLELSISSIRLTSIVGCFLREL